MQIQTLIQDIYTTIQRKDGWFNDELARDFSSNVGARLQDQLGEKQGPPTLRLSQMGPRCPKALWHSIHRPELAEALPPQAEIKYSYGHIIEALVIVLAEAAGHRVEGKQDVITLDGVSGHRDCVIDGCTVDIKSSSSLGMVKFKTGSIAQDDPFGYLDQLDGYVVGSYADPLVLVKDKGYLLAVDKTLGHMVLYEHRIREERIRSRIREHKRIVSLATPPACTCGTVEHGKSGNIKLDTKASYSLYKHVCFPNLRTFLYSDGPVYLTKVERLPDVPEITRSGIVLQQESSPQFPSSSEQGSPSYTTTTSRLGANPWNLPA